MRIAMDIDRDAAVAAGRDVYGRVIIEVDPAEMASEDRDTLAAVCDKGEARDGYDYRVGDRVMLRRDDDGRPVLERPQAGAHSNRTQATAWLSPLAEATPETLSERLAEIRQAPGLLDAEDRTRCGTEQEGVLGLDDYEQWMIYGKYRRPDTAYCGQYSPWRNEAVLEHAETMRTQVARAMAETAERDAEIQRRMRIAAARREADAQAYADQRAAWIEAHGSPRLRRLATAEIEHDAVYRDERLAVERSGWRYDSGQVDYEDPRNCPESALDLLDHARQMDQDAYLQYIPIDDRPESAITQAYVAVAEFLGRDIVLRSIPEHQEPHAG